MSLVENIKKLADSRKINITELGTIIGVGKNAIYRWDESFPSYDKLQKVADYFKVSTDHLIYGFNRALFAAALRIIMNGRNPGEYADQTGINRETIFHFLEGSATAQPSLEIIEKIVNDNPIPYMISAEDIYGHAGYDVPEHLKDQLSHSIPSLTQKYELDAQEEELLKVFKTLSKKSKALLLARAYELEEDQSK